MSTENLCDRIKFFKQLEGGQLSELKNKKAQLNRSTSKIKIPTIFVSESSDDGKKELRRHLPFGSASNLTKNKLLDRSEMTQSAFSLNNLGVAKPEIEKAKSQENLLNEVAVEEGQLNQNSVTSSFDVLSKFKAVENLADTNNLDTQVKENLEEANEVSKPKILDIVYKKMEENAEDKNKQFRQRLNELKIKRTNSLNAAPEEEKKEPKPPLFVKKLKEIKSKPRSTDLDAPRSLVFNFIKKNDNLSKSFTNLSILHQEAEVEERKKDRPFHKSSDDLLKIQAVILDHSEGKTSQDKSEPDTKTHREIKDIPRGIQNQYIQNEKLGTPYAEEIVYDNLQEVNEPLIQNKSMYITGLNTPNIHLKQDIVYEADEECESEQLYVNEKFILPNAIQEDDSTLKVIPKVAPRSRNVSENVHSEETVSDTLRPDLSPDAEVFASFEQSYDELTGRKSSSTSGLYENLDSTPRIVLQLESPDIFHENQDALQSTPKVIPRPAPRRVVEDEMINNEEYVNLPLNSPPISPKSGNSFPKAAPRIKTPHTSESEMNAKDFIRQSISGDSDNGESMYENLLS